MFFGEVVLLDCQMVVFFVVIDDVCDGIVFMLQVGLVSFVGGGIGVVDFGVIDFLEGFYCVDGVDQFQVCVVMQQVVVEVEGQWCGVVGGYKVVYCQVYFGEVGVGQ